MSIELLKNAILENSIDIFEEDPLSKIQEEEIEDGRVEDDDFLLEKVDGAGSAIQYSNVLQETIRPRKKQTGHIKYCKVCGGSIAGNNRTNHNKTKIHILYENMNDRLRSLVMNDTHKFPPHVRG